MQSETIGALVGALAKAQEAFDAAVKTSVNPHFKSKYAPLDVVIDATGPALRKNGLAVVQTFATTDAGPVLRTTLAHSSGEWIAGEQLLLPVKPDPQGLAAASTYARRYGWQAIVGIAAEDDDGNTASKAPANGKATAARGAGTSSVGGTPVAGPAPAPVATADDGPADEHWSERIVDCSDLDDCAALWAELGPWLSAPSNEFHARNTAAKFWAHVNMCASAALDDARETGLSDLIVAVAEHEITKAMKVHSLPTYRQLVERANAVNREIQQAVRAS